MQFSYNPVGLVISKKSIYSDKSENCTRLPAGTPLADYWAVW